MSGIRENFNKIMIVDDEKLILLAMSAKLKREGYVPVPVGDVDSAVGILKEIAALIIDVHGQYDNQRLLDPAQKTALYCALLSVYKKCPFPEPCSCFSCLTFCILAEYDFCWCVILKIIHVCSSLSDL